MMMRPWACVLNSFSFVSGIKVEHLLKDIGHDGSDIINFSLPEPYNRRGFNVHELSYALYKRGFRVIELPRFDYIYSGKMDAPIYLNKPIGEELYKTHNCYCVTNDRHMCGYKDGRVYDALGKLTELTTFDWDMIYLVESTK